MKKIIFKSLRLQNFKGIRDMHLEFSDSTRIDGRNGSGKTTIADAVSWVLFGKNASGDTVFGIKTKANDGQAIPHLEHSVSLTLEIDGEEIELRRLLQERWQKIHGEDEEILKGNEISYFINKEKVTKSDYNVYISSLCDIEMFRLLTVPSHFASLPWKDQLDILNKMVGDIDYSVLEQKHKKIIGFLQDRSVDVYIAHIKYMKKKYRTELEEIPVKISTYNDTLPDETECVDNDLEDVQKEYDQCVRDIESCKLGSSSAASAEIEKIEREMDAIRQKARLAVRDIIEKQEAQIHDAQSTLSTLEGNLIALGAKRNALSLTSDRCTEEIRELDGRLRKVKEEGTMVYNSVYVADETLFECPTCGQLLPEDKIKETSDKARKAFNERKAQKQSELLDEMKKIQAALKEAEELKAESIGEYRLTSEAEQRIAQEIQSQKKVVEELRSQSQPTVDSEIANNSKYSELLQKVEKLRTPTEDNSDLLNTLEEKRSSLEKKLAVKLAERTKADYRKKILAKIAELQETRLKVAASLTTCEKQEDAIAKYLADRDRLIESRINSLFKYAKFRLWKATIDGTKEQYCVVTYNGVEYQDLNKAMKITIGIDIINALANYYSISAPIIIDNAESCNNLPETVGQKIALYVTNDDKLIIR